MNSRMDKYTETPNLKSRSEKNKVLYEKNKNVDIDNYDVNNNTMVLEDDVNNIDVDRVGDNNQLDDSTIVGRGRDPNFNLQDYLKNKPQNEPVKNDVAQDPNIGERQV